MIPTDHASPMSGRWRLPLMGLILILATLLRLRELDRSPLWWDEGNNAYFAHQSLAGLVETSRMTRDTDPPAHRLALNLWLAALGDSAFNLRLLSVAASVGTVALVLAWGSSWLGLQAGALAGLLTALSPMMITYGREAKGYAFVTLLGTLAAYLWACHLDSPGGHRRIGWWIVYVLAETLAVGAHYYAIFLIVAQGIWLLYDGLTRRPDWMTWRRRALPWILAQIAVAALLAPWVWLTGADALLGARHVPLDRQAWSLLAYLRHVIAQFAAGPYAPGWADVVAALALFGAAAWAIGRRPSAQGRVLATLLIVPMLLGYIAQRRIAFFWPRFLLYATPPLYMLAAWGITRLRRVGLMAAAALIIAWGAALPTAYTPFMGPEEDLRPVAQPLRDMARPGDSVIVSYIWQEGILRMLAPDLPVTYHLGWFPAKTVDAQMMELVAAHPRLWLVTYRVPLQHPVNPGGGWLEQRAARALSIENGPTRIALYLAPCGDALSSSAPVTYEGGIRLQYAPLDAAIAAGHPLPVTLRWVARQRISERYTVFVHLYDQEGKLIAQADGEPVNGLVPFTQFEPEQAVLDCRAVLVPATAKAGRYRLAVGLYDANTGQRVNTLSGPSTGQDQATLGEVLIQ